MAEDIGSPPEMTFLPIEALSVDGRYQRDTGSRRSKAIVARIAADFRWPRFGAILAARSGNGFAVIDGQHRVAAARLRGDITHVPAIVLPHDSVAAAAADFVAINRDRVAVTPLHIHHAMVAAGEPRACETARVCAAAGVSVCRYPVPESAMKPGQTLAVAVIGQMIRRHGAERTTQALRAMVTAAGGQPGQVRAATLRAACAALAAGVSEDRLAAALKPYDYADLALLARDRQHLGAFQTALTAVIADLCAGNPGAAAAPRRAEPAHAVATSRPRPAAVPAGRLAGGFRSAVNWLRDRGFEVVRAAEPREGWQIGDVTGYSEAEIIDFARRMKAGEGRGAYR